MKPLLRTIKPPRSGGASGRLIVVEEGAGALDAHLSSDGSDETTVVAEGAGESRLDLPFRVIGRLAVVERSRYWVKRATVLVAPRLDAQSVAGRSLVAQALLAHMTAAGGGELVLAGDGANADLRHELLTLVEALLQEHEKSTVTIRLQLHAEGARVARASGTYPVVRAPGDPASQAAG